MPAQMEKALTPQEIESICAEAPEDAKVKIFCINGVIVEIPFRKALERLPYDVMMMQQTMHTVITAQVPEMIVHFLTPMTSDMILQDVGGGTEVCNINKGAVNAVAGIFGGKPVFGDDHDGILKSPPQPPMSNNPEDHLKG